MAFENPYHPFNLGELPPGCQYCVRGEKLVLFVTGVCPRTCYFCPVSDQKFQQDVIYANERKVESADDILKEAHLMDAKGAGITGGDPLSKLDRTIEYIKLLKEKFGKGFHIHLYTSLNLATEENLGKLWAAGLDELRFHLELESKQFWERLALARKFSWKIGVEIPLIPTKEKETFAVLEFVKDKVDFLNLNELEVADNSQSKLEEMMFHTKDELSYAIKGSLELGLKVLEFAQKENYVLPIHVCTAKLKDAVQLANRLKREARGAKKKFDLVSEEGMLTRGALYLPELVPGFGYRKKLENVNKTEFVQKLEPLLIRLKKELRVDEDDVFLDVSKPRILLSKTLLKQNRKLFRKLGLVPAVVSEYPTADQLEVEVELF
ncbi:radical SAM protein [Candidatus Woesearchaeota archaeon]|nr:radical SAM protein [Candidatus Woesearchaeota archaeon]